MLLDVVFDSLRFLERDSLDACQLASKAIRNFIDGSPTLALRTIRNVNLAYVFNHPYMGIYCQINGSMRVETPWHDATKAGHVSSLAHLRNAYIEKMNLHSEAERCVPLLSGASDALNFKVARLHYGENLQETETLEKSVHWIVHDLRVTEYELSLWDDESDDHALSRLPTTLTHNAVRASAEYLCAKVITYSRAPVIFERLFGLLFDAPKLAAVLRLGFRDDACTDFAEGFIRKFITADEVSRIARSVSIELPFERDDPHDFLPEMCVAPRQRNVDAPKTRFFDDLLRAGRHEVQKGDLYVFTNYASGRELQLFATTAAVPKTPEYDIKDLFVMTFITC